MFYITLWLLFTVLLVLAGMHHYLRITNRKFPVWFWECVIVMGFCFLVNIVIVVF